MELGGLAAAVERLGERALAAVGPSGRSELRGAMLRLVDVSDDGHWGRRRVHIADLPPELGQAIDALVDARLVARTDEAVDVVHEVVFRAWPQMVIWLEEARTDLTLERDLRAAARGWDAQGRSDDDVLRGGRFHAATDWAARRGDVPPLIAEMIVASRDWAERDDRSIRAQLAREQRSKRRLRGALVIASLMVVVALAAGMLFLGQRRNADREGAETRARELAGQARLAIDEDPERAVLLALAAMATTDEPLSEAVSALHQATQSIRVVTTVDGVLQTSFDQRPDGSLIAVDRLDATGYVIIDPATGEIVEEVTTEHQPGDDAISFAPSGTTLAVAYQGQQDEQTGAFLPYDGDPAVQRFEVPGGRVVGSLSGPAGSYHSPDHDASGRWLAAIHLDLDENRDIVVWDVAAGGLPRSLGPGTWFDFLPGSNSVVLLAPRLTGLAVVDLITGDIIREFETPDLVDYQVVEIDPSGRLAALLSPLGRRVDILNLTNGRVEATLEMPTPTAVKFSPDGRVLAVGGNDHLVRLFDMGTFTEMGPLAGSPDQPFGLAFSPDGSRLVSGTTGQVRTWDLSPEGPTSLGSFHVSGGFVGRLVVAADESAAVVSVYTGDRAALHRVDLTSGKDEELLADLRRHGTSPEVAADLSMVAALDAKDVTNVVDLATGRTRTLGRCEAVLAVDQSGRLAALDGRILCTDFQGPPPLPGPAVASRVVDLRTGRTLLDLGDTVVWGATFGPPGDDGLARIVAVVNAKNGIVTLHDLTAAGADVGRYIPDESMFPLNLAISPDGSRLALSMTSGQLIVLDVAELATAGDPEDAVAWTVTAHSGSVQSVSVSESGWIATASSAGNVRVWSADGELVADLPIRLDDPPTLAFAPGTDTLYYEGGPGIIRRLVIDPDYNARLARSLLTRGFTDDECARYFPGESCPKLNN